MKHYSYLVAARSFAVYTCFPTLTCTQSSTYAIYLFVFLSHTPSKKLREAHTVYFPTIPFYPLNNFMKCVLKELESLGKELYGAKLIAQRFQARHCSHFKDPVSGSACLLSMIEGGNPHHYFIATQDEALATKVKKKAGVPLLFIIQNTMVLDKPSAKSLASVQAMQKNQLIPEHQKLSIVQLKEEQGLVKASEAKKRKRKRTGGPNPLSCLKKKKKTQETPQPSAAKKKRNRKHKKQKLEAIAGTMQSGPQNVET
ncbi:rRNA-processing protein UTP23 homolog isoform X1 [Hemicordylus capensis]|uniref:rRNA-processing protein UTP23 homolog isoform X1 n=1 Tax=Hemicordylus capensis TaxID=884348 RepID=UPI00230467E8|nr:rRNA-processing protein UTP23 homolog isoform X1 [Hemicordylus capensis]